MYNHTDLEIKLIEKLHKLTGEPKEFLSIAINQVKRAGEPISCCPCPKNEQAASLPSKKAKRHLCQNFKLKSIKNEFFRSIKPCKKW